MSHRILITGAQGFVGRYLVGEVLSTWADAEVLGIGRSLDHGPQFTHTITFGAQHRAALLPGELAQALGRSQYAYKSCDLADSVRLTELIERFQPDLVFHMASALRGDPAQAQFRTNVEGTLSLLQALHNAGCEPKQIVLGSTCAVYGFPDAAQLPLREDALCRPAEIYGVSKLAMEHASRIEAERFGLSVVFARMFNLAGAGQDERHVCGRFAGIAAAIRAGVHPRHIQVGCLKSTRDFIDIRDTARALNLIAQTAQPFEAINIASGHERPIREVLDLALETVGLAGRVHIHEIVAAGSRPTRHVADISHLRELGFQPTFELSDTLRDLVSYYESGNGSSHCLEVDSRHRAA